MKREVATFLRRAAKEAVAPVGQGWTSHSKLCVSVPGSDKQMWIVTEISGGRHGCGSESDSFWTHTNDVDLFAGSRGYTLNLARLTREELIQPIYETLEKAFADAQSVDVKIIYCGYPNYPAIPSLHGNSNSATMREFTPLRESL